MVFRFLFLTGGCFEIKKYLDVEANSFRDARNIFFNTVKCKHRIQKVVNADTYEVIYDSRK
jgi:hypothetical protein